MPGRCGGGAVASLLKAGHRGSGAYKAAVSVTALLLYYL